MATNLNNSVLQLLMFLWMAYQIVAGGFSRSIHSVQVGVLCQDVTLVAITLIPFSTPGSFSPRWAGEYIDFLKRFYKKHSSGACL